MIRLIIYLTSRLAVQCKKLRLSLITDTFFSSLFLPWWLLYQRQNCCWFIEKSIKQLVTTLLEERGNVFREMRIKWKIRHWPDMDQTIQVVRNEVSLAWLVTSSVQKGVSRGSAPLLNNPNTNGEKFLAIKRLPNCKVQSVVYRAAFKCLHLIIHFKWVIWCRYS